MCWPMHQQRVLQLPTSKPSKHELEFATPEPTKEIKSLSAFQTFYKRQVLGRRCYSKEHPRKDWQRANFDALSGSRTQSLRGMTYDSEIKSNFTRLLPIHQQIIDIPISLFYIFQFSHPWIIDFREFLNTSFGVFFCLKSSPSKTLCSSYL